MDIVIALAIAGVLIGLAQLGVSLMDYYKKP
jgi:hypothetical protein